MERMGPLSVGGMPRLQKRERGRVVDFEEEVNKTDKNKHGMSFKGQNVTPANIHNTTEQLNLFFFFIHWSRIQSRSIEATVSYELEYIASMLSLVF